MEIEKKYLIQDIPFDLKSYNAFKLEQGYISVQPVIRIRKADDKYILTVKSKGLMERQEYELPLSENEYMSLMNKVDGNLVSKTRYIIPLTDTDGTCGDVEIDKELNIELDVFAGDFEGLIYAEVEFPSGQLAEQFVPPKWFFKDVTFDSRYHNSSLSSMDKKNIAEFLVQSRRRII
ncbi:MAG: CYTH domain-containing protein [Coprococcus sp.]